MAGPDEPTQNQRKWTMYMCYGLMLLGAFLAWGPPAASDPKTGRIGYFLMVIFAAGAWLIRRRMRQVDADDRALAGAQRDLDGKAVDMEEVLARHGVKLDWSTSDPQTALLGGMAKASFYRGCQFLDEKKYDDALASFTRVIGAYKNSREATALIAAAHCQRASAHEGKGDTAAALADYHAALALAPNHPGATAALARLSK